MTYFELLILAVSLTFDTFAVSVSGGISLPANVKMPRKAAIIAFFGFFQAAYLFAGWFVGGKFANFIVEWDHWVAFGILAYLGGKMLFGAIGKKGECCNDEVGKYNFLSWKRLAFLATATSIDAVAVGASMALLQIGAARIFVTVFFTFAATALASFIGLQGGRKLGCRIGNKAEMWGGVILILIGIKILIEHIVTFQ